ncbi:MAG: hypothetical protein PHT86_05740 [Methanocorpusculum sp.]|nr:hypothetical protein [Methanocorpusculum sp.]
MAGWMRSRRPQLSKALPCGDTAIKKNPLHEIDVQPKIHTVIPVRFIQMFGSEYEPVLDEMNRLSVG